MWRVEVGGCIYSISANSQKFDSTGGSGNVSVTPISATGCTWTATSNAPWITVNSTNSTTANYSVAANNSGAARVGSMTIAGRTFEVTQGCNSISTTSVSVPSSGGASAVNVNVPVGGCPWTAISNVPWIQIVSGSSGSTSGTVNLNVEITNSTSLRTGTLTIAGQTVTVTQAGATQLPTLTGINPNTIIKGGTAFTLTATGTNFTANSVIVFKGVNYATTFLSSTQLTAQITATDIATAGIVSVKVATPVSGGGISAAQSLTINNTVPTLTSLSPAGATAGSTGFTSFTLTVTGTNFANNSIVRWNGTDRVTTFVSGTQLKAQILVADVANAGTASVTVFTPTPGGGTSNTQAFPIVNLAPTLTALNPTSALVGGASFTLNLLGRNFINGSEVRWNGVARPTTYIGSTVLTAEISASDIANVGTASITVFTPAPGGGTSQAISFPITGIGPTLTSINPTTVSKGGAAFTLTATGTNFTANSVIAVSGVNRTTTFVSSTQLTTQISAADIASVGILSVLVVTPGGGTSTAQSLTINNPAPALTAINPTSVVIGSADFTLTLTGSNFTSSSVVRWNGVARTTTFVSSTQLTTLIKATEIVSSGTAKVSVFTPTPGGGTSGEQAFTLTPRPITTVSAASYTPTILGKDAIASAFGLEMATTSALATTLPLPTTLGGTTVKVKDSAGVERSCAIILHFSIAGEFSSTSRNGSGISNDYDHKW